MLTKEECHEYWRNSANSMGSMDNPIKDYNNPILYASKPRTIIDYLHNFWTPEVSKNDTILELGCSSGANLNYLRNLGYTNLDGIDINEQAIFLMSNLFPETYEKSGLYIGSLEEILPTIPDKSIDISFSIYTLSHIHSDIIDEISKQISRITKKYVITIENEKESINERVFIHDYKHIFERVGCDQIKYTDITKIPQEKVYTGIYNPQNIDNQKSIYLHSFDYYDTTPRMFKINNN